MKIAMSDDGHDVDDGKVIVCLPRMGLEGKLIHSNQSCLLHTLVRNSDIPFPSFSLAFLFWGPPPIQIKIK